MSQQQQQNPQQQQGHEDGKSTLTVSAATQQLLSLLEGDAATTVPEELAMAEFRAAGCSVDDDPRLARLAALAGQHFLAAVLTDAAQLARRRAAGAAARSHKGRDAAERRLVLLADDVAGALRDYGISCRPAPYFVNPSGGGKR